MSLKLTDAYELITRKILINKMSVENLEHHSEFYKANIKMLVINMKIAEKKVELINQLNTLLEQQLSEFSAERQKDCMKLYIQINSLDRPTKQYKKINKDLTRHQDKMLELIPKIQYIESTIPAEKNITNYNIKIATGDESIDNSCGGEL